MSGAERHRAAGLLVPLSALRSARGWGIGEIGDLGPFAAWTASTGHRLIQLLPLLATAPGERSPYAPASAFALDPLYVSLADVEDFVAAGGEEALAAPEREVLAEVRAWPAIAHERVEVLKRRALEIAYARFVASEWRGGSARARAFERFRSDQADWLSDWALFRACAERHPGVSWREWPRELRERIPAALASARTACGPEILFHEYVQWLAADQWRAARNAVAAAGVRLKGDVPFVVGLHSADVWTRQREFDLEARLGAPPDAFAEGQDWGLPAHRWDVMARGDFSWMRARAAHGAAAFDALRIDHVVGLYRQWVISSPGRGAYVPAATQKQRALGECLLGVLRESACGAQVFAEDLGVIPAFVRRSLASLGIPGYRVLRWEEEAGAYRDPRAYPAQSVATTGTHDTSTLAAWWEEELDPERRRALAAVPSFAALAEHSARFTAAVHGALLEGIYGAGSDLVVLPIQDTYGGKERINVPATVGPANWSYRLPWAVEELAGAAAAPLRDRLRGLTARHGR